MIKKILQKLKTNWKSGLSLAVVSVPLSISFAIASGAAPIMGLITSAWAGLAAALLGGSHFNVISPAGAFAGILTAVSLQFGMEAIPIVTALAGVIMFFGALFNAQRFLRFIPGGAIFGFTLGIAAIIAGTQLNSAFGLTDLPQHESILKNIVESISNLGSLDIATTIVFAATLAILFAAKTWIKKVPAIIVVTPLALVFGWLVVSGVLPFEVATLQSTYGSLQAQLLRFSGFSFNWGYVVPALTIALVGILETMLSAKIADGMTGTRHNQKREMMGLSAANLVSGFVGGMPATGVFGPTALNIASGGNNRMAAILKAIFVAAVTLLLFSWFAYMPMPAIAAILVLVAITMIERKKFLLYYKHDRHALLIALLVMGITLYKDPALGILVGSVIGLLLFADKVSRGQYQAIHNSSTSDSKVISDQKQFSVQKDHDVLMYSIQGVLTHLNGETHFDRLRTVDKPITTVVLRMREVTFIDIEGVDSLDLIISELHTKNIVVMLSSLNPYITNQLMHHSKNYAVLKKAGLIFTKTSFALESVGVPPKREEK